MKLSNAFSLLSYFRLAIQLAFYPTLQAVLGNIFLLLQPHELSKVFFANVWVAFGDGTDSSGKAVKDALITPNACGVVLDIGAGHGHTVLYLNHARVSHYIALEPNMLMHTHIRAQANKAGYHESDGTLLILSCGAEDTASILSILSTALPPFSSKTTPVDTIVSVLTLCTIPQPERTMSNLVRDVLKPGGQLLMYEHVLSPREDVAWWQKFWAPVWAVAFDGCRMDRASDTLVRNLVVAQSEDSGSHSAKESESMWREVTSWGKEGEDEENLFWHSVGKFVKK